VAFGAAAGGLAFAVAALGVLPEALGDALRAKVTAFGAATPARYAALAVFYTVGHSFLEEYYWRGFVHVRLRARLSASVATAVSSLAFASHHFVIVIALLGGVTAWAIALAGAVALGGAAWARLRERSGGLRVPWLSHALADAGVFAAGWLLVFGG